MKHLSQLLPAQTIVILNGKESKLKELLKLTFLDLLLKDVLKISSINKQPSSREAARDYQYVTRGKEFPIYNPAAHEMVFLSAFHNSASLKILLHHLIRIGHQNSKNAPQFVSKVITSGNLHTLFTQNFFQKVFGGYTTTENAKELRKIIAEELEKLEKELPATINLDKEKATEILKNIGGNIFLLKNVNYSLLAQIDSEILSQMNRATSPDNSLGGFGCGLWDFESVTGGTGCSGCSGCSGCGGGGGGD